MSSGIQMKDMLKAFEYTQTKSGPVVPARTASVKMMKGTLGPVGDQTSQKWDRRKYENDNLETKKNYLSLKDIGIKIMTEASTMTSYEPMRLNLSGMDMEQTSLNGNFNCDGQNITMNIRYPNANDDMSVELVTDKGRTMLYEVPLDSDQFKGNFAQSIRQSARNLIQKEKESDTQDEIYGAGTIKMPGNDFNDSLNLALSDTNNITAYESVDWKLQKLLEMCNDAEARFEAEGDFSADEFAAPADDGSNPPPPPMGGDGSQQPQSAGDVNGVSDGNGKGEDDMFFAEYANQFFTQAAWDSIAQLVSDAAAYITDNGSAGVKPSADEWYEGFPGFKNESADDLLEEFLAKEDYKALGDGKLPKEGLDKMAEALETGKVDVTKFKTDLGKWFPDVYNTDGTAMHDVAKEAASTVFPQDDQTGVGQGMDMNSNVDFGGYGEMGDMMDQSQQMFGNNDFGVDMSENGSNSEEPGKDKTDLALDSLDNLF